MEIADAKTTAAAVAVSPILSSEDLHALHEARQRYLEQQTILREVEELLVHAAHTLDEDGSASALAAMGLAGCNRDAVTSLGKHLAAAHAAQRLRLPDAPPGDDAQGDTDQLLGSRAHALGVTPAALRKQALLPRKAAQRAHAALLPALEARIEAAAAAAVEAVTGPDAGADAAAHAANSVTAARARVDALRHSCSDALARFVSHAAGHLDELQQLQAVLVELLDAVAVQQPQLDGRQRQLMQTSISLGRSKLQLLQQQARELTYDGASLQALAAIHRHLTDAEREAAAAAEQVSAALQSYEQLGQEFDDIVADYGAVKAKVAELDGVLAHLTRVERETAEYGDDF